MGLKTRSARADRKGARKGVRKHVRKGIRAGVLMMTRKIQIWIDHKVNGRWYHKKKKVFERILLDSNKDGIQRDTTEDRKYSQS